MSIRLNYTTRNLYRNFESVFNVLSNSLLSQFNNNDSIINPEAQIALNNPIDRIKIDQAVQELKSDRRIKRKTITLSNHKNITLSVE